MNQVDTSHDQLIQPYRNGIRLIRPISSIDTAHKSLSALLSLPCNTYLLDTDSRVCHSNESNLNLLGVDSVKQALGKTVYDVGVKRECADKVISNDRYVMDNNVKNITEEVGIFNDDRIQTCLSIKMPWYNANDKIIGILGCSIMFDMHPIAESLAAIIELGLLNQIKHTLTRRLDTCFTLREQTIIEHLVRGKTARQIGEALYLSHRTIEHYIESIKDKMGVKTKSQLIEKAISFLNV